MIYINCYLHKIQLDFIVRRLCVARSFNEDPSYCEGGFNFDFTFSKFVFETGSFSFG